MPKMIALHDAAWRGRTIAHGDVLDVSDACVAELAAHGFVEAGESAQCGDATDVAALSRRELLRLVRGRGAGNVMVLPTGELRKLAAKVLAGETIGAGDERG